jgi:predicted RNase H-like HicB family nuclease
MEYVVVIHEAEEGGFWAEFPALPGCFTQGETIEEVLRRAPEAVESHVEVLREDGQEIPGDQRVMITTIRLPEPSAA